MRARVTLRPCLFLTLFVAISSLAGCQIPGANPAANLPGGNTTDSAATPTVQFTTPADNTTIRDDSTLKIRYSVTTDRALTASVQLDPDGTPNNGNEVIIASNREIPAAGGSDEVEFVAGRYPYGKYFVRVTLDDGASRYQYNALGTVNVVPLINNVAADNNDALQSLNDLSGLRLLYTTGSPGPINSRVPFVATWKYPDFIDKLDPLFIAPFELNYTIEVRRLQFYTWGHTALESKHVEIYQGTDQTTTGTLIRQIDQDVMSFATGGWNMVTVDPPLVLTPGKYGISFHAHFEFADNWAGNAAKGAGYAWISPYFDTPYRLTDAAELGFVPNFTFRVIGRLVPETNLPSPNSRLSIPTPLQPVYPDNGSKPPEGLGNKNEDVDAVKGASPFHVTWQLSR